MLAEVEFLGEERLPDPEPGFHVRVDALSTGTKAGMDIITARVLVGCRKGRHPIERVTREVFRIPDAE